MSTLSTYDFLLRSQQYKVFYTRLQIVTRSFNTLSNIVITYIDGQEVKTLLDTGAQISFMSDKYAKKRGFKIQPLEKLVNFTGGNGLAIEYSGYVEVNLQLPNKGFNQDILILVFPHIEYHNFVPITLGTHTLETIDEHLVSNNLVQNLETEWRLVHQAMLYRQSLTKDHILGLVRATKNIIIQPFSCVNISGLVRAQKGGFSLHVVAKPSIQAKLPEGITLAGEQYLDITQGSSRVGLLFENQTEKPITIKERTILCQLVIGNLVPKLVGPKYDISELDRHFLEEEILTELDKEEEGYSPDEPMDYHEFKKTSERIPSTSPNSGLKSANGTVSLSLFADPERILRRFYVFAEEPCKSNITTSEPCSPVFKEAQPRPSNLSQAVNQFSQ